jgi:formate/nitrite transporter FocA (FNT family)
MKNWKIFLSGIAAGLFIGIGSFAFVASVALDGGVGKIIGSILFSVGLFLVCFFQVHLYTGKIGFLFENKPSFLLDLLLMLIGNVVGACGSGYLAYLALSSSPDDKIYSVCWNLARSRAINLGDYGENWYKAFFMAVFCGMLVFLAVYVWKKSENWGVKIFGLVMCVTAFVVTGMEHCIANMFYFSAANEWNLGTVLNVLICIVGDSVGSWLVWLLLHFTYEKWIPKASN